MEETFMKPGRSGFRYRANRNEELTIQNELEEVEKQSLKEISANRELRKQNVLSEEYRVTRKLAPHFIHKRVTEKRKSEPMFPSDAPLRTLKPKLEVLAMPPPTVKTPTPFDDCDLMKITSTAPPNSPSLGRSVPTTMPGPAIPNNRTKKFPFCKTDVIKTQDMTKTRKTSVGVVPLNRDSMEIGEMKVIMTGKLVNTHVDLLDNVSIANRCDSQTLSTVPDTAPHSSLADKVPPLPLVDQEDKPLPKPAILGQTGTTLPIKFSQRQKPPQRPMTKLKPGKRQESEIKETRSRSAKSIASSLMSGEIILPEQNAFSQYDQAIDDLESGLENVTTAVGSIRPLSAGPVKPSSTYQSRPTSTASYKSAKALLEEAKRLTSPKTVSSASEKLSKFDQLAKPKHSLRKGSQSEKVLSRKDFRKGDKGKARSMMSSRDEDSDTLSSRPRSERTVDEIITQLRIQSRTGEMSEADVRIQEIMNQVLSRTSTYLSDASEAGSTEDVEESEEREQSSDHDDETGSSDHEDETGSSDQSGYMSDPLVSDESPPLIENAAVTEGEENLQVAGSNTDNEKGLSEEDLVSAAIWTEFNLDPSLLPDVPPPVTESESDLLTPVMEDQLDDQIDIQQAWQDLLAPPVATYEDIVSVYGKPVNIEGRLLPQPDTSDRTNVLAPSVSFLSTWAPVTDDKPKGEPLERVFPEKTIHHFCTATVDYQLPKGLQGIGRKYHTPSRYEKVPSQPYRFADHQVSTQSSSRHGDHQVSTQSSSRHGDRQVSMQSSSPHGETEGRVSDEELFDSRRQSLAATRIMEEACLEAEEPQTLEMWQQKADKLFSENELGIDGKQMELRTDESRLYWTPAPPRLDVPPAKVKEKLFPQYEGRVVADEYEEYQILEESSEESEDDEPVSLSYIHPDDRDNRDRTLARQYRSNEDLTWYKRVCKKRQGSPEGGYHHPGETDTEIVKQQDTLHLDGELSITEIRQRFKSDTRQVPNPLQSVQVPVTVDDTLPVFPPLRKTKSVTKLTDEEDDTLIIPNDFTEAMEEMDKMKKIIADLKSGKKPVKPKTIEPEYLEPEYIEDEFDQMIFTTQIDEFDPTQPPKGDVIKLEKKRRKSMKPSPAEQALAAGRAYVIIPKIKKKPKPIDMSRVEGIQRFLSQPSAKLSRSKSISKIHRVIDRELRVPQVVRSQRRGSLPTLLDFDQFVSQRGKVPVTHQREWAREIWNVWFDQVYPPTPDHSDGEDGVYPTVRSPELGKDNLNKVMTITLTDVESVECLDDNEENQEIRDILMEEVCRLTEMIESSDKPVTFHIGRRGAIYRKLGKLKKAMEDIDRAIHMEPLLLDAYWHRHLISLTLGKKQAALDDLTYILKHNKKHAGAYRSILLANPFNGMMYAKTRAEVFRNQGEITMAIVNYTQAIKLNPEDHDAFSRRAEMYEKRGEMRLALEDYSKATKLQPTKTDAIFKHGMYFFENQGWTNAINDFTDLLKVDPTNSLARMYRGMSYASLGQYNPAVADLSGAIHYNPNNWRAFYQRGCLLRRAHPQRALLDFSMSLLIEDSEENIMAYFHRGILYNFIDRPQDAIPDFEAMLKLDNNMSSAHINLGLIYMTKFLDFHRAIKKFTSAIKVEPTCVRAIVCRGQCYHKIHDLPNALRDFTRAIHLSPDVHHYYMYRGQLVLEMGDLDLAGFCVRHASELGADASLGQNAPQQAVVQTFLKNYEKAVDVLVAETRVTPVAPVFMLLGKTQIKAKSFKDAINSFERALALYKPWSQWELWPVEAAQAHFLIGTCQTELRNYLEALEAFNSAIKINSHHAESFYQRGLTRIRLKQSKGIQDFNRALAIDPTLFQVYLSRACYYGMKGKFAKAILNCNEALKIQPQSVRAYLYRGSLKYHIKAYELAIRDLSMAASIDNTCALAFFNRAVCFQHNKQHDKALTDYGIVLLLGDELSIKVLINRGLLYFEQGDYTNALYDFKISAKLHPWDYKIHHSLGLCYHKLNQLQESVVAFTKSLSENPFFLEGLVARGNVYMDYGHEAGQRQARVDYQRALMYNPSFLPARVNLAYSLQMRGNFMQAWRHFTAAISVKPTYCPALEGRSIVNLQMRDQFAAFQDISSAINVSPSAELYTNRGVINQFMKDGVNAMKDYQLAVKKDPTYSLAYFNAANIHFHTRHFKQALDYYNKAIKYNPKDESAYLNRAITKVLLGDATGALDDFKCSIKLSPHSAHIYFNRGNLYASLHKLDKAELDYSKALFLKPDDPLVLKRRADVRGKLGRKEEAIQDYRLAITIQGQQGR